MSVYFASEFTKNYKKLKGKEKGEIDDAINDIIANPEIGKPLKYSLKGLRRLLDIGSNLIKMGRLIATTGGGLALGILLSIIGLAIEILGVIIIWRGAVIMCGGSIWPGVNWP